jgi:hypothetical protein
VLRLLRPSQSLNAGYDIKQFLIDFTLPQPIKRLLQVFTQLINISFCTLHCGKATRVFACQGFGAGPEKGYEEVFPYQCLNRFDTAA